MKHTKLADKHIFSNEGLHAIETLCRSSSEGIIFCDNEGKIILVNPRAEEMFGYTEEELLGERIEILVPKESKSSHTSLRNNYIKQDAEPRRMGVGRDLEGLRKDGKTFPLEISLSHITGDGEKLIIAFITDISIRKENERKLEEQRQQLKEYTSELERKVKARTSELEHMNLGLQSQIQERKLAEEALKESLQDLKKAEQEILKSLEKEKQLGELKSRFVSMASHEFRTPLTTVLSSANLIARYTEGDQQDAREKHIDRIKKSVQNLTSILNDFLSIEKLESGAQKVDLVHVEFYELLRDVVEEMSISLKEGQEIVITGSATSITSDPHILKNILINLISNASKYSGEKDKIEIKIEVRDSVLIHVTDQGIGIPKSEQKELFGRFFRAGNATNIQGTGLGLNIVKKYTDLLNGQISFTSTEGKGSTFTLQLPLTSH
ncbi:MAG: PAS domain-containing sensor histidine kinase [Ekhidna sp.]|uniref:PAS domain-containing sensor histidine kinase n=1 Tax=Ekhidna sp. TaxID=2608089 RepID=UPI0032EEC12F